MITITKVPHNGALILSAIRGNQMITRTYYGHTRREALRLFIEVLSLINS